MLILCKHVCIMTIDPQALCYKETKICMHPSNTIRIKEQPVEIDSMVLEKTPDARNSHHATEYEIRGIDHKLIPTHRKEINYSNSQKKKNCTNGKKQTYQDITRICEHNLC